MTDDLYCQRCSKQLPISVNYNRKYCDDCQRIHQREWHQKKYLKRKNSDPLYNQRKKTCRVCNNEFVYKQGKGRSRDICTVCVDKYIVRVLGLTCLLCGKKIEQNAERVRFAFCSVECSKPAWYILRRYKKEKVLIK